MNQITQPDHPSASNPPLLQVSLLGRFQVNAGGQPVADRQWRLRKSRNLLKLLALAPQHRLHREQLLDALWPELPAADAAHNLHQVLYIARRALDPGGATPFLQLQDDVLSLGPASALWIDAEAFEMAAAYARQTRDVMAYRAALDLYTGELLPDDRYEDWASARRESLHRTYLELLSALAQLYEHALDYAAAIETAERILVSDPAQEEAHRSLMRLYARSGRRPQALRQYQLLTESLRREVDAEPDAESEHLYQQILAGQFAPATLEQPSETSSAPPQAAMFAPQSTDLARPIRKNNLPRALDSFIGREAVMTELKGLLARSRLVTLTGSGGCGKTRLAIQVASELVANYPDGVWLVECAALSDPTLVAQEVGSVLGVREQPGQRLLNTLIDALRNKDMLLLFDNCEHLITACAQLAESLLRACARLRILATSREALHLAGETNHRVPSLSVPAVSNQPSASFDKLRMPVSAQQGIEYEAVRLFVDRAESANRSFRLTDSNASAVAQICAQLDGMPLAIELAAARVTSLSAEQIAARLEDRFRLLTGGSRTAMPRQQTLQAAIDWSYSLLAEPERVLLRRLSVFAGGWTLEAAEVVCADDAGAGRAPVRTGQAQGQSLQRVDILDLLTRLVDKSLVTVGEEAGEIRYGMLETIRQYAYEKLVESSEMERLCDFHLHHFICFVEEGEQKLYSLEQVAWLRRFEAEHDNLRTALRWTFIGSKSEAALWLTDALAAFWGVRGHWNEGRYWLQQALALSHRTDKTTSITRALQIKALIKASSFSNAQGDYQKARTLAEEALARQRGLGAKQHILLALHNMGRIVGDQGDYVKARTVFQESLVLSRELGDTQGIAQALHNLGVISSRQDDHETARKSFQESLALRRELGNKQDIATSAGNLAGIDYIQGNYVSARILAAEALTVQRKVVDKRSMAILLCKLGELALISGDYETAWALNQESNVLSRELGYKHRVAITLAHLGILALNRGNYSISRAHFTESLTLLCELGDKSTTLYCLAGWAILAQALGQTERATKLSVTVKALLGTTDRQSMFVERHLYERTIAKLPKQLNEPTFTKMWFEGHALTLEQAIAEARQVTFEAASPTLG